MQDLDTHKRAKQNAETSQWACYSRTKDTLEPSLAGHKQSNGMSSVLKEMLSFSQVREVCVQMHVTPEAEKNFLLRSTDQNHFATDGVTKTTGKTLA